MEIKAGHEGVVYFPRSPRLSPFGTECSLNALELRPVTRNYLWIIGSLVKVTDTNPASK